MSSQAQLSATLVAGPAASSDGTFPSAMVSVPFTLNPENKTYNVTTGAQSFLLNSPSAFVALPGIGAGGTVQQAQLLYARAASAGIRLRVTYLGDGTPKVHYMGGVAIFEPDPSTPITLVEAQGSGAIEFFACGLQ